MLGSSLLHFMPCPRPRFRTSPSRRGIHLSGLIAAAFLAAAWMQGASPASAHAVLVRSDPAANARLPQSPKAVSIYFSEPLEPRFSSMRVVDPTGAAQDQNDSRVDAGDATHMTLDLNQLKPGIYSVAWTTVSRVDGHKLQGSYPFIVLSADGSLPAGSALPAVSAPAAAGSTTVSNGPAYVIAYWLAVLGAVSLFGGAIFALAVALPAAAVAGAGATSLRRSAVELQLRLLWAAVVSLLLGELALLALQLHQVGGLGSLTDVLSTSYGAYLAARLVLAGVAALCLLAITFVPDPSAPPPLLTLTWVLGLSILACFSLTSHAAAVGDGWIWGTLGDLLHVGAVGLWVGGLLSLAVLLLFGAPDLEAAARLRYRAASVSRFSPLAAASVPLILLSGLFSAVIEIPTLGSLLHTGYGRALLLKIAVICLLLAVAGVNAFVLRRRFVRSAAAVEPIDAVTSARRLSQSVALEAGLAAAVLLVVGLLLIDPPARALLSQTPQAAAAGASGSSVYSNTSAAGDLAITLTVDPNKVGLNTYRVKLADAGGPVSDALLVRIDFTFADPKFGTSNLTLPATGPGIYQSDGANFAQVGRWGATVVVRRPGRDDALSSFTVEVPDQAGNLTINRVNVVDPFASPSRLFTSDQLGGVVLALAGLLPLVLRRQLWRLGVVTGAAGTFAGVAGLVLGGTLFFAAHQEGTTDYTLLPNPVPVSNQSVADGQAIYMQNCVVCHGQTGHGDGPAAQSLNPKPFDLTVHVGLHADGVLWGWISDGIPRTAMPAWKTQLSENQRWEVVDFLRTEFQTTAAGSPADDSSAAKLARASAWAAALDTGTSNATP
jgi:copper transport protein